VEVPLNAHVEIHCGRTFFAGKITHIDAHDAGFRLSMEFSPLTPWSLERFRPEHLLDLAELANKVPSESP
jgi:hypothetical protein